MDKNVPHDFMYHAEIMYEGETAMRFTCAASDTIEGLVDDIVHEFKKIGHRHPVIVKALVFPNGINQNITNLVVKLHELRSI